MVESINSVIAAFVETFELPYFIIPPVGSRYMKLRSKDVSTEYDRYVYTYNTFTLLPSILGYEIASMQFLASVSLLRS